MWAHMQPHLGPVSLSEAEQRGQGLLLLQLLNTVAVAVVLLTYTQAKVCLWEMELQQFACGPLCYAVWTVARQESSSGKRFEATNSGRIVMYSVVVQYSSNTELHEAVWPGSMQPGVWWATCVTCCPMGPRTALVTERDQSAWPRGTASRCRLRV